MKSIALSTIKKKFEKPRRMIEMKSGQKLFHLAIIEYLDDDDTVMDTNIISVGLAAITGSNAECALDVNGPVSDADCRQVGETFLQLLKDLQPGTTFPFATVVHGYRLSSFPKKNDFLVFDHDYTRITWLVEKDHKGRLLEVVALFKKEAAEIEQLPVHLRAKLLQMAVSGYRFPKRKEVEIVPTVLSVQWHRVAEWYAGNNVKGSAILYKQLNAKPKTGIGKEIEEKTGVKLPLDFITSLETMNASLPVQEFIMLTPKEIIKISASQTRMNKEGHFPKSSYTKKKDDRIINAWWHPHWIPFAKNSKGDLLCIDMAPGPGGMAGQVIIHDTDSGPTATDHNSFHKWLEVYFDDLRADKYGVTGRGDLYINEKNN